MEQKRATRQSRAVWKPWFTSAEMRRDGRLGCAVWCGIASVMRLAHRKAIRYGIFCKGTHNKFRHMDYRPQMGQLECTRSDCICCNQIGTISGKRYFFGSGATAA